CLQEAPRGSEHRHASPVLPPVPARARPDQQGTEKSPDAGQGLSHSPRCGPIARGDVMLSPERQRLVLETIHDQWGDAFDALGPVLQRAVVSDVLLTLAVKQIGRTEPLDILKTLSMDYLWLSEEIPVPV